MGCGDEAVGCGVVAVAVAVADAMRFATICSIHSCWAGVNEGTASPSLSVIIVHAWMDSNTMNMRPTAQPDNRHHPRLKMENSLGFKNTFSQQMR